MNVLEEPGGEELCALTVDLQFGVESQLLAFLPLQKSCSPQMAFPNPYKWILDFTGL